MITEKDTYKYQLVKGGKIVLSGVTYDFHRRGIEHRSDFPYASIRQVGSRGTRKVGLRWLRRQKTRMV